MPNPKRLTISLGQGATVKPGDVLRFNLKGFFAQDAETSTKYSEASASISVQKPKRVIVPRLFVRAPKEVG